MSEEKKKDDEHGHDHPPLTDAEKAERFDQDRLVDRLSNNLQIMRLTCERLRDIMEKDIRNGLHTPCPLKPDGRKSIDATLAAIDQISKGFYEVLKATSNEHREAMAKMGLVIFDADGPMPAPVSGTSETPQ